MAFEGAGVDGFKQEQICQVLAGTAKHNLAFSHFHTSQTVLAEVFSALFVLKIMSLSLL